MWWSQSPDVLERGKKVLVAQSCQTHCDPRGCSPPGSSVCGTLQALILEWVAISFSRGSSQPAPRSPADGIFTIWVARETQRGDLGQKSALVRCEVWHLEQSQGSWLLEQSEDGVMVDLRDTGFQLELTWVYVCMCVGKVKVKSLSHVWLFATPWIVAYQAPPSMGFFPSIIPFLIQLILCGPIFLWNSIELFYSFQWH